MHAQAFVKNLMCSYEKPGWPGYRDLVNRARNLSHMNTPAQLPGRNVFDKIVSLSRHSDQNGIIFCHVCISTSIACELALLVKLQESTKLQQSRTVQIYVSLFALVSGISSKSTGLKFPI